MEERPIVLKILLAGNSVVGKTSLINQYVDQAFPEQHISTLGVDFKTQLLNIDDTLVKLQLWDTAGQERFKSLSKTYFRGADAIIVVYDISSQKTFDGNVCLWLETAKQNCQNNDVVLAVVGNKHDLSDTERQVDYSLGEKVADSSEVDIFLEVSAKTNYQVTELFHSIAKLALERKLAARDCQKQQSADQRIVAAGTQKRLNLFPLKTSNDCCC